MPASARVTKMWIQQKGLIPLLFLAFSAYFLWDGAFGYRRSDERWDKHQELKDKPGEWEKYAAERGWKTTPPDHRYGPMDAVTMKDGRELRGFITAQNDQSVTLRIATDTQVLARAEVAKLDRTQDKYLEQFVAAAVTGAVGLWALIYWMRQKRRVIRNDAEGIYDPATRKLVPYTEIFRIDKTRWKSKGFAYLYYRREGKESKITFDDAKYDATALETVLAETEAKVAGSAVIDAPVTPAAEKPT